MWKKILGGIACALLGGAAAMKLFPQSAPFAAPVEQAGVAIGEHASRMLDYCGDRTCGKDPRDGSLSIRGRIALHDGGACVCE